MKLKQLLETYETSLYKNKGHVFVNPSPKEMMIAVEENEYQKEVRFSAYPKLKKIYVFSSHYLHSNLRNKLGFFWDQDYALHGVADLKKGKWIFTEADEMDFISFFTKNKYQDSIKLLKSKKNSIEKWITMNFKWADKYILITPKWEDYKLKLKKALDIIKIN